MPAMPPPNIMSGGRSSANTAFRSADHEQMRRRVATLESQVRNLTEVVNTLIDVVVAKDAAP